MSVSGSSPRNSLELTSGSSSSVPDKDKAGNKQAKGGERQDVTVDIGKAMGKHDVGASDDTSSSHVSVSSSDSDVDNDNVNASTTTTTNEYSDNPDYSVYMARLQTIKSNIEPKRDFQGNVVNGIFEVKQEWLDAQAANPRRDNLLVLDALAAASTLTNAAQVNAPTSNTTTTTTAATNANPGPLNPPGPANPTGGLTGALAGLRASLPTRQQVVIGTIVAMGLGSMVLMGTSVPAGFNSQHQTNETFDPYVPTPQIVTRQYNTTETQNVTTEEWVAREEWKVVNYSRGSAEVMLEIPLYVSMRDALEQQWNNYNRTWVATIDGQPRLLVDRSQPAPGQRDWAKGMGDGTANISHFVDVLENVTREEEIPTGEVENRTSVELVPMLRNASEFLLNSTARAFSDHPELIAALGIGEAAILGVAVGAICLARKFC